MTDDTLALVFSRAEALAAGWSLDQIDRRIGAGGWSRLRAGQYTSRTELDEHRRWQAEVLAVVRSHRRNLVLSHTRAARAWGLPRPWGGWGPMTFVSDRPPSRRRRDVRITVHALNPADLEDHGLIRLTSPARTVVDCARTLPGPDALAVVDAALRRGLVTLPALDAVLEGLGGWPGIRDALIVVALADPRRETRRAGALVVRWGPRDVLRPAAADALVAHLRSQIASAARLNQFTGRVVDA